jgi:hypothetical protein
VLTVGLEWSAAFALGMAGIMERVAAKTKEGMDAYQGALSLSLTPLYLALRALLLNPRSACSAPATGRPRVPTVHQHPHRPGLS